jgi:phosphatidylserine decarboxylase
LNSECKEEEPRPKIQIKQFVDFVHIKINEKFKSSGYHVKKGDEIGLFEFGRSSIIVLFENGRIRWDQDLIDWSMKRIMVDVEVGVKIGEATKT